MRAYVLKLPIDKQFIIKNTNAVLPVNIVILSGINDVIRLCHPEYREKTFNCVGFEDNNIIYRNFLDVIPANYLLVANERSD